MGRAIHKPGEVPSGYFRDLFAGKDADSFVLYDITERTEKRIDSIEELIEQAMSRVRKGALLLYEQTPRDFFGVAEGHDNHPDYQVLEEREQQLLIVEYDRVSPNFMPNPADHQPTISPGTLKRLEFGKRTMNLSEVLANERKYKK